jgi:hypothetical protein
MEFENFQTVVKHNKKKEEILNTLYNTQPVMFSNIVISALQTIAIKREFHIDLFQQMQPILKLIIINDYARLKDNAIDKLQSESLIDVYVTSLVNAFLITGDGVTGTSLKNKLIQLLNLTIIPTPMYGAIFSTTAVASIKFPVITPEKMCTLNSDLENVLNSDLNNYKDLILATPTETFTYTPATSKILYSKPLIYSVVEALVGLENTLMGHALEHRIKVNRFLNVESSKLK